MFRAQFTVWDVNGDFVQAEFIIQKATLQTVSELRVIHTFIILHAT